MSAYLLGYWFGLGLGSAALTVAAVLILLRAAVRRFDDVRLWFRARQSRRRFQRR